MQEKIFSIVIQQSRANNSCGASTNRMYVKYVVKISTSLVPFKCWIAEYLPSELCPLTEGPAAHWQLTGVSKCQSNVSKHTCSSRVCFIATPLLCDVDFG